MLNFLFSTSQAEMQMRQAPYHNDAAKLDKICRVSVILPKLARGGQKQAMKCPRFGKHAPWGNLAKSRTWEKCRFLAAPRATIHCTEEPQMLATTIAGAPRRCHKADLCTIASLARTTATC
jgi:hypothetical protein